MEDYLFRLGQPNDYPQIKLLAESIWAHDYLIEGFLEILNDPKSHFLVVESSDHEILGYINALIYTFNNKRVGYLETLRVKTEVRKQGIGSLLTKEALQYLESKHIRQIGYVTGLQNKRSIQIALKNGFIQIIGIPATLLDCTQIVRLPLYERKFPPGFRTIYNRNSPINRKCEVKIVQLPLGIIPPISVFNGLPKRRWKRQTSQDQELNPSKT